MSFRTRLLIFFVIIVVVPMIAVGLVLFSLTGRSEVGRLDASLAQGLRVAGTVYREQVASAEGALTRLARDRRLRQAFAAGEPRELERLAQRLRRSVHKVRAVTVLDPNGRVLASEGAPRAIASASVAVTDPDGVRLGRVAVSTTASASYAAELRSLTRFEIQVARGGELLASTLPARAGRVGTGSVIIGGDEYRGADALVGSPANQIQVAMFAPTAAAEHSIRADRVLVLALLLGFIVLALASSIVVVRALQGQIGEFLEAARAIGRGEFGRRVPTHGRDEFSALGEEFNAMSSRLAMKIEEVERQREELEESIRRVGQAFAAGLDSEEVLGVAVRTAVEACGADAGRALGGDPPTRPLAAVGDPAGPLGGALHDAERRALEQDEASGQPAAISIDIRHALAMALTEAPAGGTGRTRIGVISVARDGMEFTDPERELFAYLAARTAISLENAELHRTIREQAITDGLTGLFNRRHLEALLETEVARTRRFGGAAGLLVADIDDFKLINDRYGHQKGDETLIATAELLRRHERETDTVARYGGDEFIAILPETDVEGAARLAERLQGAAAELDLRTPDGRPLAVTASFGVASVPESAADADGLIAAADMALYAAKRAGKNRVARAEPAAAPR